MCSQFIFDQKYTANTRTRYAFTDAAGVDNDFATVCRLLGILLARVVDVSPTVIQEGCPIELLSQLFIFYLGSRSALQKSCTADVISEWAAAVKVFCYTLLHILQVHILSLIHI